jgi:hypothetical protein
MAAAVLYQIGACPACVCVCVADWLVGCAVFDLGVRVVMTTGDRESRVSNAH